MMGKLKIFDGVYTLCRWALGSIFIYAGSTKLFEPGEFALVIQAYGLVPEAWLMPLALGLPVLEILGGMGLIFDIRGSVWIIAGLLGVFVAVVGYGIWMGLDVDCGCFGPEDPESKAFHGLRLTLVRDLVMMAGLGFIYGWRRYRSLESVTLMGVVDKFFFIKKENI